LQQEELQMNTTSNAADALEIIAFRLHHQEFCVKTTSIREIRGWAPVTPIPHSPYEVLGVMNLRGTVIPIVDLAVKLGMPAAQATERSAVVVTEVNGMTVGLLVDGVSDILTVAGSTLQPLPAATGPSAAFSDGIIAHDKSMICFLSLERMFGEDDPSAWGMAA
jgi:purine-binding chemotaxis protein CheW